MTRVLLAAPQPDVRAALRLLLLDLDMEVVGEAADWPTNLALAPETRPDMLLVDWELIPIDSGNTLTHLRAAARSILPAGRARRSLVPG
jgi:DNA-binding NarL/FixJ family response regulator